MRAGIFVDIFNMGVNIAIADTTVGTVTSFRFKAGFTATFTKETIMFLTALAEVSPMEAISAVFAEMLVILQVFNA